MRLLCAVYVLFVIAARYRANFMHEGGQLGTECVRITTV